MSNLKAWLKSTVGWPPSKERLDAVRQGLDVAYQRHTLAVQRLGAALDAKDKQRHA